MLILIALSLFLAAFFGLFAIWLFVWTFTMSSPDILLNSEEALIQQAA